MKSRNTLNIILAIYLGGIIGAGIGLCDVTNHNPHSIIAVAIFAIAGAVAGGVSSTSAFEVEKDVKVLKPLLLGTFTFAILGYFVGFMPDAYFVEPIKWLFAQCNYKVGAYDVYRDVMYCVNGSICSALAGIMIGTIIAQMVVTDFDNAIEEFLHRHVIAYAPLAFFASRGISIVIITVMCFGAGVVAFIATVIMILVASPMLITASRFALIGWLVALLWSKMRRRY